MRLMLICAILALAGCAANPGAHVDPSLLARAQRPLICPDAAQCAAYWQRAQVWIIKNSSYRIQTVSEAVIVTFGPFGGTTDLAFNVTRSPGQDGSATIDIDARCDNIFGCFPNPWEAIASFKQFVGASD